MSNLRYRVSEYMTYVEIYFCGIFLSLIKITKTNIENTSSTVYFATVLIVSNRLKYLCYLMININSLVSYLYKSSF